MGIPSGAAARAAVAHTASLLWVRTVGVLGMMTGTPRRRAACLLVSADVFRQGVIFPDTPVNHLIESEGFGYLAREKGFTVVADLETYVKHA